MEARIELEAGGTVEEMESRGIGLHVLLPMGAGGLNQSCV